MSLQQQPQEREAQYAREQSAGEAAKALADHPYLNRVLDDLERAYFEKWRDDETLLPAQRDELWHAQRGLQMFRQQLRATISSGQVARAAIDKMARTKLPA